VGWGTSISISVYNRRAVFVNRFCICLGGSVNRGGAGIGFVLALRFRFPFTVSGLERGEAGRGVFLSHFQFNTVYSPRSVFLTGFVFVW